MTPNEFPQKPKPIIFWVLWAAFVIGLPQMYYFLGVKGTSVAATPSRLVFVAAIPLLISTIIRWLVLPKIKAAQKALPLFILGIAFSEMVCFLGLFIFAGSKLPLFCLSLLGVLQFAPYYAGKYE